MAIIIYPNRATEQDETNVPPELFASGRFLPIYLDELSDAADRPVGLELMLLTIFQEDNRAIQSAQELINQNRSEADGSAIMSLVTEIMVYRFAQLSREEIEFMLDITLQETRVYREAKAEGSQGILLEQLEYVLHNKLSTEIRSHIQSLSLDQLSALAKALLTFQSLSDLEQWLAQQ